MKIYLSHEVIYLIEDEDQMEDTVILCHGEQIATAPPARLHDVQIAIMRAINTPHDLKCDCPSEENNSGVDL